MKTITESELVIGYENKAKLVGSMSGGAMKDKRERALYSVYRFLTDMGVRKDLLNSINDKYDL